MTLKVTDMTGRVLTERRVIGRGEYREERFTLMPAASGKVIVTLQQGTQRVTRSILIK